jgi:hypothetical protein
MRQLMSVADKGARSTYTIVEEPDILSLPGYANSWLGDRPGGTIAGAEAFEPPPDRAFDALEFAIEPSFEPLYESTGKHVDIRVWDSAKYQSRVRGLYITENDTAAMEHFRRTGYDKFKTVCSHNFWFFLSRPQDIDIIEQTWTGNQDISRVNDGSSHRVLISLCVKYLNSEDGAPIRELTYVAIPEALASKFWYFTNLLQQEHLYISGEEVGLKLREAWASSHEQYFLRYMDCKASVLCVTASEFDKLSSRAVLSFREDRETIPYARRLDKFFKDVCENPSRRCRDYEPCSRYNVALHTLMVRPYCIEDPTQSCVFVDGKTDPSGIWVYVTDYTSQEINTRWIIRQLVQMLITLKTEKPLSLSAPSEAIRRYSREKILLWIVSDPQWDLYLTIKATLKMPCIDTINEALACYRRVLLKHRCRHKRAEGCREGYINVERHIQETCKNCAEWFEKGSDGYPTADVPSCDEDYLESRKYYWR